MDTNADKKLDAILGRAAERQRKPPELRGKIAIANARLAYQAFEEVFGGARFEALKAKGARLQRPLWASTSTKDPATRTLYYVEALVASRTPWTRCPPRPSRPTADHGDPKVRIRDDLEGAHAAFRDSPTLGDRR